MRKSKLESHENILAALVKKPLTLDRIAYETNMDCMILRRHLDFLMKNGIVEERGLSERTLYALTEKGMAVLKTLNFKKYLTRISGKIRVIDEALEIISKLEKTEQRKKSDN